MSAILGGSYAKPVGGSGDYRIAGFFAGDEIGPATQPNRRIRGDPVGQHRSVLHGERDFRDDPEDELEVEEAFFRTLALPSGLTLKGGRFFSGFGYLNEFHAHAWDFVDQPLVYQAFGGQRAQDGVQLKWLAPTDFFSSWARNPATVTHFPERAATPTVSTARRYSHTPAATSGSR